MVTVASWLQVAFKKPRTQSNFLKCIIYHYSNKNTKRQKDRSYKSANKHPPHQADWQNLLPVLHLSPHPLLLLIAVSLEWYAFFSARLAAAAYNHLQHERESCSLEVVVAAEPDTVCFVSAAMASHGSIITPCQRPTLCLSEHLYWKWHFVYSETILTLLFLTWLLNAN